MATKLENLVDKPLLGAYHDQLMTEVVSQAAFLGEDEGDEVIADFDPQTDTVWKKAQVLSSAERSQVQQNINVYDKSQTYTKTEVNGLVSTPHQNYVTVATYASLPATGSEDTIYRVSNYDGANSQVDITKYSEYAWNGSAYMFLRVESSTDEVFDISVYNSNAKYDDLADALGTNGANVPAEVRRGGMSIKYVSNSDNNYVQYRYMGTSIADADFTNVVNWQGVDENVVPGSGNLVESGGVANAVNELREDLYYWTDKGEDSHLSNTRINADGTLSGESDNRTSLFEIEAGKIYKITLEGNSTHKALAAIFTTLPTDTTAVGTVIQSISYPDTTYITTVLYYKAEGNGYIGLSSYGQHARVLAIASTIKEKVDGIEGDVQDLQDDVDEINVKFFDGETIDAEKTRTTNTKISSSTTVGASIEDCLVADSYSAIYSASIPNETKKIVLTNVRSSSNNVVGIALVDTNGKVVQTVVVTNTEADYTINIANTGTATSIYWTVRKSGDTSTMHCYVTIQSVSQKLEDVADEVSEHDAEITELEKAIYDGTTEENEAEVEAGITISSRPSYSIYIDIKTGDYVRLRLNNPDGALIENPSITVYKDGGSTKLVNVLPVGKDVIVISPFDASRVRFSPSVSSFSLDDEDLTIGGTIECYAQIVSRETALDYYVKELQAFVVENGHITNAMLEDGVVSVDKVDALLQQTLDLGIVDYYVQPLREFDLKIRAKQNTAVANILFMTDLHFDAPGLNSYGALFRGVRNMLNTLRYYSKERGINLFCLGGDYPQLKSSVSTKDDGIDNIDWMHERLAGYNCPVMALTGNHEEYYSGAGSGPGLTYQESFNFIEKMYILKNKFGVDQDNHVSWMDDNTANIRYIFINVYGYAEVEDHKQAILRVAQGKPNGYDTICFCHFVAEGLTLSQNVKNTVDYLISNGETIIAWIAGHNHRDAQWVYNNTLFISCLQSGFWTSAESMDGVTYEHVDKTIDESAATMFVVDKTLGKLYAFRLGLGVDREFNYNTTSGSIGLVTN